MLILHTFTWLNFLNNFSIFFGIYFLYTIIVPPLFYCSYFLSCFIPLTATSSKMLDRSNKSVNPCVFLLFKNYLTA